MSFIGHLLRCIEEGHGCVFVICSAYEDGAHLDVLIIKLDPQGNELWTYYFSGGGHSFATGLALDSSGDLWVTGWTDSASFPLVNPLDSEFQAREIFLLEKLRTLIGIMVGTVGEVLPAGQAAHHRISVAHAPGGRKGAGPGRESEMGRRPGGPPAEEGSR